MPHLLLNSIDLVEQIKNVKIKSDSKFMNIDIEDYFMSGHQSDLVEMSGKHVLDNRVDAFKEALKFILETQFVKLQTLICNFIW